MTTERPKDIKAVVERFAAIVSEARSKNSDVVFMGMDTADQLIANEMQAASDKLREGGE